MAVGLGEDCDRWASFLLSQALCPSRRSVADRSVDHYRCICPREASAAVLTNERKSSPALRAAAPLCLQRRPTCCVHPKCCHTTLIAALIVGSFHTRFSAWAL